MERLHGRRSSAGFSRRSTGRAATSTEELADFYPQAKVLLSVRDPQSWQESMRQTVWAVRHGESLVRLLSSAQAHVNPAWKAYLNMIDGLLWRDRGTFAGEQADTGELIEGMLRHERRSGARSRQSACSSGTSREGWEPLCEFLELPVPEVALPRINDRAEFLNRIIDGSLDSLMAWRTREVSVDPAVALGG